MRHPKMQAWDDRLKVMFDRIDDLLEDEFGMEFPLHPNRARRNRTSNKESDGLFNVGADFSTGYGSRYGRGYVVDIHLSTLSRIPDEIRNSIESRVLQLIDQFLPIYFPDRQLKVDRDGKLLKIFGDLTLGDL